MGARIIVYSDGDGTGTVEAEDVPFVKGRRSKFENRAPWVGLGVCRVLYGLDGGGDWGVAKERRSRR